MDVTFVVDGDVLLVSFHVLANPRAKAEAVRKFVLLTSIWYTTRMQRACTVDPLLLQCVLVTYIVVY